MIETALIFIAAASCYCVGHWMGFTRGRHDGYQDGIRVQVEAADSEPEFGPLRVVKGGKGGP